MSENQTTAAPAEVAEKNITTTVLNKVNHFVQTGELVLPKDYSAENALKSAYLILSEKKTTDGKPVLEYCTKASIANALLNMVSQGLSIAKNQCYFIPYGQVLNFQRSYLGSVALAKRVGGVERVVPVVIYEGDDFAFGIDLETGYKRVFKHDQKLENINNDKIKGAYAVVHFADGHKTVEIMTMDEIKAAWNQGQMKGNSPAHKNFTQEMAKKTVIARACKEPISTSNDSHLFGDGLDDVPTVKEEVRSEIDGVTVEDVDFDIVTEKPKEEAPKKQSAKNAGNALTEPPSAEAPF
jgi:recombination protein RecT